MAQIRFNIGVPRAGSAARDAESAREHFPPLRPEAGSAARQAEEERRHAENHGISRTPGGATLRMRGASRDGAAAVSSASTATAPRPGHTVGQTAAQSAASLPNFAPMEQTNVDAPNGVAATSIASAIRPGTTAHTTTNGVSAPHDVSTSHTSIESNPLQSAAAKFRSLFRSMLPRGSSEN